MIWVGPDPTTDRDDISADWKTGLENEQSGGNTPTFWNPRKHEPLEVILNMIILFTIFCWEFLCLMVIISTTESSVSANESFEINFNLVIKNVEELNQLSGAGSAVIARTKGGAMLKVLPIKKPQVIRWFVPSCVAKSSLSTLGSGCSTFNVVCQRYFNVFWTISTVQRQHNTGIAPWVDKCLHKRLNRLVIYAECALALHSRHHGWVFSLRITNKVSRWRFDKGMKIASKSRS